MSSRVLVEGLGDIARQISHWNSTESVLCAPILCISWYLYLVHQKNRKDIRFIDGDFVKLLEYLQQEKEGKCI